MSRVLGSWSESAGGYDEEKENMAYCLILLAKGQTDKSPPPPPTVAKKAAAAEVYRCKTCFKSFASFQALGGHRTSHNKKPTDHEEKKSLPSKDENERETTTTTTTTTLSLQIRSTITSRRVHECSVCGAGFVSGQALGGHMRRHRPTPASARVAKRPRNLMPLDLNLPAPPEDDDDDDDDERESDFSLAKKERIIVFSASPILIDCPY